MSDLRIPLVSAAAVGLLRGDDLADTTLAEIEGAHRRAWGSLFVFSLAVADDPNLRIRDLADALVRATHRGVDVRVLLNRFVASDGFESNLIAAHWLLKRGVSVRVYRDERRPTNHAKAWIVDDTIAILGSANWTSGGLFSNIESSVRVISSELTILLADHFERRWQTATIPERL